MQANTKAVGSFDLIDTVNLSAQENSCKHFFI